MSKDEKELITPYGIPKDGQVEISRAAKADAIARRFINEMMPQIKQTMAQVEAMKAQKSKGVPYK